MSGVCALSSLAWGADLSGLPIGFLRITEDEEGQINVVARCVPAEDLLKELAERAGQVLDFPVPLRICISLPRQASNTLFKSPQFWLEEAITAGGLAPRLPDGASIVQIASEKAERYDATLDESEVMDKCKWPTADAATAVEGRITGAVLILRGKFIPPPYHVAVGAPYRLDVQGVSVPVAEVLVNGAVWTIAQGMDELSVKAPKSELPAPGQFRSRKALRDYVWKVLYPTSLRESGVVVAREKVVEFLRGQDLIKEVVDPIELEVIYSDDPHQRPHRLKAINYNLQTAQYEDDGMGINVGKTAPRLGEEKADELRHALAREQVILKGTHGRLHLSGADAVAKFRRLVVEAYPLPLPEKECVLAEMILDREPAREFAANLSSDYEALTNALDGLLAKLQQARVESKN